MTTPQPAHAINIVLDYSYDTSLFFSIGNPSGAVASNQARAALQAAAGYFSDLLDDSFSAVEIPPDYHSSVFSGVAFWDTALAFTHPSTGTTVNLTGQSRLADEYRIYVGAQNLGASTLGRGGPVGEGWSQNYTGDGFTSAEIAEINAITASFSSAVETRGEAAGFSSWGGTLSFDSLGTAWHYDHTTVPSDSATDFYSVAIHELGHALGIGSSEQWSALAASDSFTGIAATAEYGGPPPLDSPNPTRSHWASKIMSTVYGTNTSQEAAMDPSITEGTRKFFTSLDAAALTDIGWELAAPTTEFHPADFNSDTLVNGSDLTEWETYFGPGADADADEDGDSEGNDFLIWQRSIGASAIVATGGAASAVPEPGAAALSAVAGIAWVGRRRRR